MSPLPDNEPERSKRLRFRAWHRGTRESDYLLGCFFDRFHGKWSEADFDWFEALLDEEDPDVLGWIMGTEAPPAPYAGALMDAMKQIDYVTIPR